MPLLRRNKRMATIETATETDRPCWRCRRPAGEAPFCPYCEAILPLPAEADYFTILGLDARRMRLEPESLEESFYALSRQVHPDRYQNRSPGELQVAEERSASLNVAYQTLRNPVARAEYLLSLEGDSGGEAQSQPSAELLLEIMEIEETVEAYRDSEEADREDLEGSLKEAHRSLETRSEATEAELHKSFERWDRRVVEEGSDEAKAPLLSRFREILHHRRYLATIVRDVAAALASEPPPERDGG